VSLRSSYAFAAVLKPQIYGEGWVITGSKVGSADYYTRAVHGLTESAGIPFGRFL
jgi:hypothetical protein